MAKCRLESKFMEIITMDSNYGIETRKIAKLISNTSYPSNANYHQMLTDNFV